MRKMFWQYRNPPNMSPMAYLIAGKLKLNKLYVLIS